MLHSLNMVIIKHYRLERKDNSDFFMWGAGKNPIVHGVKVDFRWSAAVKGYCEDRTPLSPIWLSGDWNALAAEGSAMNFLTLLCLINAMNLPLFHKYWKNVRLPARTVIVKTARSADGSSGSSCSVIIWKVPYMPWWNSGTVLLLSDCLYILLNARLTAGWRSLSAIL